MGNKYTSSQSDVANLSNLLLHHVDPGLLQSLLLHPHRLIQPIFLIQQCIHIPKLKHLQLLHLLVIYRMHLAEHIHVSLLVGDYALDAEGQDREIVEEHLDQLELRAYLGVVGD